jgi:LacI family transcriptional regulator
MQKATRLDNTTIRPTADNRLATKPRVAHVAIFVDTASNYGRGILEGVAEYLETRGPWSIYLNSHSTGTIDREWLKHWTGDGMLAFVEDRETERWLCKKKIPVVELYGQLENSPLPTVCGSDEAIGALAARYLIDRGLQSFAFSGYPNENWANMRQRGFIHECNEAGFKCATFDYPRSVTALRDWERWQRQLAEWLQKRPRGLGMMACSDRHAQRILDACKRVSLNVPDDVAVIGVDNDVALCQLADPQLSSIADNPKRIGFEAAALLDQIMQGKKTFEHAGRLNIPPRGVVARSSTEVRSATDPLITDVLRFIRDQKHSGTSVKEIVAHFDVPRSVFFRRFRKATGRTPHSEILRARIDRVKHLLVQTSLSAHEIAVACGFEHPEYMGAMFKKATGQTPGDYRRERK